MNNREIIKGFSKMRLRSEETMSSLEKINAVITNWKLPENPRDVFFESDIEKVFSKIKPRDIVELCIEAFGPQPLFKGYAPYRGYKNRKKIVKLLTKAHSLPENELEKAKELYTRVIELSDTSGTAKMIKHRASLSKAMSAKEKAEAKAKQEKNHKSYVLNLVGREPTNQGKLKMAGDLNHILFEIPSRHIDYLKRYFWESPYIPKVGGWTNCTSAELRDTVLIDSRRCSRLIRVLSFFWKTPAGQTKPEKCYYPGIEAEYRDATGKINNIVSTHKALTVSIDADFNKQNYTREERKEACAIILKAVELTGIGAVVTKNRTWKGTLAENKESNLTVDFIAKKVRGNLTDPRSWKKEEFGYPLRVIPRAINILKTIVKDLTKDIPRFENLCDAIDSQHKGTAGKNYFNHSAFEVFTVGDTTKCLELEDIDRLENEWKVVTLMEEDLARREAELIKEIEKQEAEEGVYLDVATRENVFNGVKAIIDTSDSEQRGFCSRADKYIEEHKEHIKKQANTVLIRDFRDSRSNPEAIQQGIFKIKGCRFMLISKYLGIFALQYLRNNNFKSLDEALLPHNVKKLFDPNWTTLDQARVEGMLDYHIKAAWKYKGCGFTEEDRLKAVAVNKLGAVEKYVLQKVCRSVGHNRRETAVIFQRLGLFKKDDKNLVDRLADNRRRIESKKDTAYLSLIQEVTNRFTAVLKTKKDIEEYISFHIEESMAPLSSLKRRVIREADPRGSKARINSVAFNCRFFRGKLPPLTRCLKMIAVNFAHNLNQDVNSKKLKFVGPLSHFLYNSTERQRECTHYFVYQNFREDILKFYKADFPFTAQEFCPKRPWEWEEKKIRAYDKKMKAQFRTSSWEPQPFGKVLDREALTERKR
jgi:hypothetical protein